MPETLPPAAAYRIVAAIVGHRYFCTLPPREGLRVVVTGTDDVETVWDMTPTLATLVRSAIERHGDLTLQAMYPYDDNDQRTDK